MRFAFLARHGDIGFAVEGARGPEFAEPQRFNAHERLISGELVVETAPLRFRFLNDSSWFTAKTVFFAWTSDP